MSAKNDEQYCLPDDGSAIFVVDRLPCAMSSPPGLMPPPPRRLPSTKMAGENSNKPTLGVITLEEPTENQSTIAPTNIGDSLPSGIANPSMASAMLPPPPKFDSTPKTERLDRKTSPINRTATRSVVFDLTNTPTPPQKLVPVDENSDSMVCPPSETSTSCPTSVIPFLESDHGRKRRHQRGISVRDLQRAMKKGTRRPSRPDPRTGAPRSIYQYQGLTYVVDDASGQEVTSFDAPIQLKPKELSPGELWKHYDTRREIEIDKSCWTSHSVLLVDISGSMRRSDVRGSRTRLNAVWLSIAQDFIAQRLETGAATYKDVVTIILMGPKATILINEAPTDWILYNEIVRILNEGCVVPAGHGYYKPALNLASQILRRNDSSSCALLLSILSDGRPSDHVADDTTTEVSHKAVLTCVELLASKLGKRLTVAPVGIGSSDQFELLKHVTESVQDYGAGGMFQLPSMTSSGLGGAMSSIATSVTKSRTELAVGGDGMYGQKGKRRLRMVSRERKSQIPLLTEVVDKFDFKIYMGEDVHHFEYDPMPTKKFKQSPLQHREARGVAFKILAFGEGTERLAHQFFEVASDGKSVVGAPMVAKESRFMEDNATSRDRFIRQFCAIQHKARNAAKAFNERLDAIPSLDPSTARVSFLDCSMYRLKDGQKGTFAVLVENRLNGEFKKWNSNNGWLREKEGRSSSASLEDHNDQVNAKRKRNRDDTCFDCFDVDNNTIFVTQDEVAQAFSHFTYFHSGSRMLICDLQGVFDESNNLFRFTDPVIHYHNVKKINKKGVYGRTDRGMKGIHDFFDSHKCGALCNLVTKGFITPSAAKRQRTDPGHTEEASSPQV